MATSPFAPSQAKAGHGEIHVSILPPATPAFRSLSFTYPLKLVNSTPHTLHSASTEHRPSELASDGSNSLEDTDKGQNRALRPTHVPLVFMLSYGGGLLPPDALSLNITLDPGARLTLTTQGSTKVFPSLPVGAVAPSTRSTPAVATQTLLANLSPHAALLLSPDPVQPFARSHYAQKQVFTLKMASASLCVLDWVVEGRKARGESWVTGSWSGKNEVWREVEPAVEGGETARVLLLRDNIILGGGPGGVAQASLRKEGLGVFGTLILVGPVFERLASFFVEEFGNLPRIGGRRWGDEDDSLDNLDEQLRKWILWRRDRQQLERDYGVLWTAARVRGLVQVKFGAREIEGAKQWLASIWRFENTIGTEFGEGGLMCLR